MESPPGPETRIDGVRYLYFGGTGYLGLASHPAVIEAGCNALRLYGVHTATSRKGFGTSPPVLEVERRAAQFFGTEDAFYFTSGYTGNQILLAALGTGAEAVLVDECSHYSVLEAARLADAPVTLFKSRDPSDLARLVRGRKRVLVMADAVSPSTGVATPVRDYVEALRDCESATMLLDDAHGFGVLGENGRGLLDELGLWANVNRSVGGPGVHLCVCGTLSKALGGFGGIIPGTRDFVQRARTASHFFDGASAPASPVAACTAKALEIVLSDPSLRSSLRQNVLHLRSGLRNLGLIVPDGSSANCGLSIGTAANMRRIHETLKSKAVLVPYMDGYAGTPAGGLLRFAVFATHTIAQIDLLLRELHHAL